MGRSANKPNANTVRGVNLAYIAVILAVALLILGVISGPLRNFYQGRAEIARLNESIIAKQVEKERLLKEIDMYRDDSFLDQEARRRLGLVKEGETSFRIFDPNLTAAESLTTDRQAIADSRAWNQVLFDSVAQPPVEAAIPASAETPATATPAP
ncbi:MAG: septum formation initiator family protein [Corynebacterium sp.]|nr:septum formation initiator family protein [Corynebacterium sp.]